VSKKARNVTVSLVNKWQCYCVSPGKGRYSKYRKERL